MKLTIKTLDKKKFQVETYGLRTVWDLKRQLFNSATTNLLPSRQQIMYAGRVLKNNKLLSNYSIDERKFLLVMARKSSRSSSSNVTEHAQPAIKNKTKQLSDKKAQKTHSSQGDEASIDCNKRTRTKSVLQNVRPKQIKTARIATTLTSKKSLKIKPSQNVLVEEPPKKTKAYKVNHNKISSSAPAQDKCLARRPTSSSSIGLTDSQRSDQSQRGLMRNKSKPNNKHKSIKSTLSSLSITRTFAKKKVNKIKANRKSKPSKTRQRECDEFVLRQIVEMGYNEDDVRRALIASFNDPNEAVGYLVHQVQERIEQQSTQKRAQQYQKHKNCRLMQLAKPNKSNVLAFLRHDIDFKNLRRLLRSRPNVLQSAIKRIGASHPELLFLLKEHEDAFLQLLHENSVDSEDEHLSKSNYNSMHISPEEEKIINRLVRMGFTRQMVIVVYIACDRNVEKAVDYLCRIGDMHI